MKLEILEFMKCPYCDEEFKVGKIFRKDDGEIITGIVKCECAEYPILEGILILQANPAKDFLLKSLKEGKKNLIPPLINHAESAYRLLFFLKKSIPGQALEKILYFFINQQNKRLYKRVMGKKSFFQLPAKSNWDVYLKSRFSSETLWSIYPFIRLLKTRRAKILDLGCGIGHASFIISEYVKPTELFCCDYSVNNLFLAKKFFVQNAQFIALDANYPLPFKEGVFSSILMMDSLHYIQARALCVSELERILHLKGLLLILHLHNSLVPNPSHSMPLSPSTWANLFKNTNITVVPEKDLIEDFIFQNRLDLLRKYSEEKLNSSNALCLAGSNDNNFFKVFNEVDKDFLEVKGNLIINPIYDIKDAGEKLILKRKFPTEFYRKEYPLTEKILPEEYVINKDVFQSLTGGKVKLKPNIVSEDLNYIERLMEKFVIINVPERFI